MLKFIKGHMESIDGIALYPIIAFVIFFTFFIGLTVVVIAQRKDYYDKLSQMPLDDGIENDQDKTKRHD